MSNYEAIYDAAEMRGGKGFSTEGHRAGIAAVVAAAKAEQREADAKIAEAKPCMSCGQVIPRGLEGAHSIAAIRAASIETGDNDD